MSRPLIVLAILLSSTLLTAQQARDGRTPTRVGTASISGIVLTDERDAKPLRRARVSITGSELALGYTTITADDGSFSFERLPPGRYSVTALKEGFVPLVARPQTEQVTSAELREGQAHRVTLRLLKGAVITGTITGPDGAPAAGASVNVLMRRYNGLLGEWRTTTVPMTTVTTDDRGVYRLYGLAPGAYLVASNPRLGMPTAGMRVMTEAEVRRALAETKEQAFQAKPGIPPALPPAPRTVEAGQTFIPVPIFFPGTPTQAQAVPVTVAAGEVRTGVDFDLHYVRAATIEGFVTVPEGTRAQVVLNYADGANPTAAMMLANTGADGRFTFRNVAPGHYAIAARATPATRTDANASESAGWARTEVVVSGDDLSGVTLSLRPPVTLSGRVNFAGTADLATLVMSLGTRRVSVPVGSSMSGIAMPVPSVVIEGERFSVSLLPIRYRFQTLPQGMRAPIGRWWLTSLVARGNELLDSEIEITSDVDDAVVTFSDRASELSGTARYTTGAPVKDGHIVIFSTNPDHWFWNSRRVVALQTSDGRYSVKNLPAGDYFVTVAPGLERNEWFDPEMLAVLARTAQRVTLGEFEEKTFDVVR